VNKGIFQAALKHSLDAFDRARETYRAPSCEPSCPNMDQSAPHVRQDRFKRFADFYPYYLSEHRNRTCRRLHVIGTTLVVSSIIWSVVSANAWFLMGAPLAGYGFAWLGHFVFEKNRPATFRHPWYSLLGDFAMFRDVLTGRIKF
jgi:hypothetical protein